MHIYLGLIAATIGLGISTYIHRQKKQKTTLVCPREASCEKVVHSTYATTFGIDNTLLGIAYYTVIGLLYAIALAFPTLLTAPVLWVMTLATCFGALFSLYLIALQAFVIRAWCAWCLGSALATGLLVVALFGHDMHDLYMMLSAQRVWWIIVHNIGFILGLGGATITDIFFFRFLKDGKISEQEKLTMDTLSNVIWIGLGILVVSGLMLYLPEQARLSVSSKFLLKVIVVSVITVNGIVLNLLVAPRMRQFSLAQQVPARRFRRLAFALGGISITSWYTAFLLGSFRSIPLVLREGVALYVSILIAVILGSLVYERIVAQHWQASQPDGNLV